MAVNRLDYIDTAKGIGMLLVIMLHTSINYPNNPYFGSGTCAFFSRFFMPIFFVISGLFFSCKKLFADFIKSKFFRLVVPFVVFYVFTYFFNILIVKIIGLQTKNDFSYLDLFQVFYKDVFSNNVIWFLLSMFWCQILLFCIEKYVWKDYIKPILIIGIFSIGYICHIQGINIPLYIDTSFSALPYLYIGYLFKKGDVLKRIDNIQFIPPRMILLLFISVVSGLICYFFGTGVSLVNNSYGDPLRFLVQGISGSIMVLALCRIIHHLPVISFIGKESLIVLCTHMYLINVLTLVIKRMDASFYIRWIITIALVCCSYYIIAPLLKKYFPTAVGLHKA